MPFSLRADSPRVGSIWREGIVLQEAAGCRRRLHVCPPFVGARWRTEGGLDMTCGHGWLCSAERAKACFLRGHVPDPYAFACWRCLLDCGLLHAQPGSALRAMQAHHGPPRLSSSGTNKLVHRRKAFAGHASGAQFLRSRSRSRPCAIPAPSGSTQTVQILQQ